MHRVARVAFSGTSAWACSAQKWEGSLADTADTDYTGIYIFGFCSSITRNGFPALVVLAKKWEVAVGEIQFWKIRTLWQHTRLQHSLTVRSIGLKFVEGRFCVLALITGKMNTQETEKNKTCRTKKREKELLADWSWLIPLGWFLFSPVPSGWWIKTRSLHSVPECMWIWALHKEWLSRQDMHDQNEPRKRWFFLNYFSDFFKIGGGNGDLEGWFGSL